MEAKLKAEELVNKFGKYQAINCVNEIIEAIMMGYLLNDQKVAEFQTNRCYYWQQVKKEIKALP